MENPRGDPRLFKILNYDEIVHAGQQGDTWLLYKFSFENWLIIWVSQLATFTLKKPTDLG
jgi:hypothetical protein